MSVKRKTMLASSSYFSEHSSDSDEADEIDKDEEAKAKADAEEAEKRQKKIQKEVEALQKHGFKGTKDFKIKAKEAKVGIFSKPHGIDLSGRLYPLDEAPQTPADKIAITDDTLGVSAIAKAISESEGRKKTAWVLASEAEAARKQAEIDRLEQEERDRLNASRTETPEEEEARLHAEQAAEALKYQIAEQKRKAYIDSLASQQAGYVKLAVRSSENSRVLDDEPLPISSPPPSASASSSTTTSVATATTVTS